MKELREVTTQVPAPCLLSVDPENAESKGKARFRDILSPGSRQLNVGSSNNRISGSPAWIRTTVHGYEKEFSSFFAECLLLVNASSGERYPARMKNAGQDRWQE